MLPSHAVLIGLYTRVTKTGLATPRLTQLIKIADCRRPGPTLEQEEERKRKRNREREIESQESSSEITVLVLLTDDRTVSPFHV